MPALFFGLYQIESLRRLFSMILMEVTSFFLSNKKLSPDRLILFIW